MVPSSSAPAHTCSRFNETGTFARRAAELGAFLSAAHPSQHVVYLSSSWGELEYTSEFAGPSEPTPPHATYGWDRIPAINAEYARAARARGWLVVDPTLALSQRKDCRLGYMHSRLGVYAQATWRMLQAAFAALPKG